MRTFKLRILEKNRKMIYRKFSGTNVLVFKNLVIVLFVILHVWQAVKILNKNATKKFYDSINVHIFYRSRRSHLSKNVSMIYSSWEYLNISIFSQTSIRKPYALARFWGECDLLCKFMIWISRAKDVRTKILVENETTPQASLGEKIRIKTAYSHLKSLKMIKRF